MCSGPYCTVLFGVPNYSRIFATLSCQNTVGCNYVSGVAPRRCDLAPGLHLARPARASESQNRVCSPGIPGRTHLPCVRLSFRLATWLQSAPLPLADRQPDNSGAPNPSFVLLRLTRYSCCSTGALKEYKPQPCEDYMLRVVNLHSSMEFLIAGPLI